MSTLVRKIESKIRQISQRLTRYKCGLVSSGALLIVLVLSLEASIAKCEAKEFDWSDLGVSLANSKPTLSSNSMSNLRILVSPQRRMTKNYEFEYANNTHTNSAPQGDAASYVVSSQSGSPYVGQPVFQLAPNQSNHSSLSAYTALSASLASLKNRLNARGVTLTGSLSENGSQPTTSHLYAPSGAYSLPVDLSQHQQQHQQQQQQQQQQQSLPTAQQLVQQHIQQQHQAPVQPTYLSVSSQQDQQVPSVYQVPMNQSNENKTIVLAIPARINFLTGTKQQSPQQQHHQQQQQQQQQLQQLSVIQSSTDQQGRTEYGTKQLGIVAAPEGSLETQTQPGTDLPPEHHQYVIVNSAQTTGDHHSHSVAANLSPSALSGQVYSSPAMYQPAASYATKYIPAYTQAAPGQAQIQKVYSVVEPQQLQLQPAQQVQQIPTTYVPEVAQVVSIEQPASLSSNRYSTCLDTCNSADPRWRKYTVSKYKACCSRSSQYDSTFEQPAALDKPDYPTSPSRYAEDAYYGYLYRRSRARRSRRPRSRYYVNKYASSSQANSPVDEEAPSGESGNGGANETPSRPSNSLASTTGRSNYYSTEYPQMKHYRTSGRGSASSLTGPASHDSSALEGASEPSAGNGSKYTTKERSYRRGRSRELEPAPEQLTQPNGDQGEEEQVYPPRSSSGGANSLPAISGYGSGEFSVDSQGRGYSLDARQPSEDETDQSRYEEPPELAEGAKEALEYNGEGADEGEGDTDLPQAYQSYSYGKSSQTSRRKKSINKLRTRSNKAVLGSSSKDSSVNKPLKKARKNKLARAEQQPLQANGTDYDSAQPGDYHQEQANNNSDPEGQANSGYQASKESNGYQASKESSGYDTSHLDSPTSDKEALLGQYRANLNDTTVANLSKTTMHLKEILSILEKKALLRSNESISNQQQFNNQPLPVTSTQSPITTTSLYPSFSHFLSGSQYSSPLSSDFLTSDTFGLKSPYRFEPSSLSSSLSSSLNSSPLSLPTSFDSFGSSSSFNPLTPSYPSHYGLHTPSKHMGGPNGHPRKRRPNKNSRYNDILFQKAAHGLVSQQSLLNAATKNRFLNPAYYSAFQYPYLYRGAPSFTNSYPYKNIHKSSYSPLIHGPSKLPGSGSLYSDESRIHGLTSLDPMSNLASSMRPSSMRMRNKPFVFQPQVLPIYTRHAILTQPLDVKA